jgi:hypothetical protein
LVRVGPGRIVSLGSIILAAGVAFGPRLLVVGVEFHVGSNDFFEFTFDFELLFTFARLLTVKR